MSYKDPKKQKLPTEHLPESERTRAIINMMREGVICTDAGGVITEINTTAENFLSVCRDEVVSRTVYEFHPPDIQHKIRTLLEGFNSGTATVPVNIRRELDGHWLQISLIPVHDENGKFQGVVTTLVDETEQKRLEEVKHSLELKLLQEHKLSVIGVLASGIAHNLNGPLSIIVGYLDLLYSRIGDLDEIPIILSQTERMKEIINNMMYKSRQEQDDRKRMINLNTLLKNELAFLDANLDFKHKIDKQYEFAVGLPDIFAVYSDFSQSFLNIINNSIDAMFDSPVKNLFVKTSYDSENITIEFQDTGCGLDPADAEKIFDPFYTTKPLVGEAPAGHPTGTGLGLSSTHKLVQEYGGEISVNGHPGKGAHFIITIPIKANLTTEESDYKALTTPELELANT
ncbi:hypothetical protein CEE37_09495 [candidate division LCP-89 bacterium B3_LCP]|uniref:histidine kinase n=1 Tax=candidate division LCP-89 bacterium B3_LCP TaxID=2012998 RepID=A0A532UYE4_UNCL8|nr:MAG: hypothetical protein CEE37_09495 [candidate division LCP-89 bacterium B3_LCP]